MQQPKLTREFVSSYLKDAIPEYEEMLVFNEQQGGGINFTLITGLRQGNVLKLEWSQVDMARHVCWIHPDQAKARKAIHVPLNSAAMDVLTRQIGKHPQRVFSFRGKPIGWANTKSWRNALKRAGIEDFRWHDLRHK